MTTTLPTEDRPVRMAPELSAKVEEMLEELSGNDLEKAQDAVMRVYHSGVEGSFGEIVAAYRDAIEGAVEGG